MDLRKRDFSLWCDFIERDFLSNRFVELLNQKLIYGLTSNPSIFSNAILNSSAYHDDIKKLKGNTSKAIYENLAFADVRKAAQLMLSLWQKNNDDGLVSIEIDPSFCNDAPRSIDEAKRIIKEINMPNVMVKVPATESGFEIIDELCRSNININVTLVFSAKQTKKILDVVSKYNGGNKIVISVFVSRFDRLLESKYRMRDSTPKLGIYNAMSCYNIVENHNNPNIRTLFASTSVKDDFISKDYYVSSLLLKHSINTTTVDTIDSFILGSYDIIEPSDDIDLYLGGFDLDSMSNELLNDGLNSFVSSFENMLRLI